LLQIKSSSDEEKKLKVTKATIGAHQLVYMFTCYMLLHSRLTSAVYELKMSNE